MFASVAGFAYRPADPWDYTRDSLDTIVLGGTAYWFLPILVAFFVASKLLRRAPHLAVLLGFLLLVAQPDVSRHLPGYLPDALATNLGRFGTYALWFLVGCYAAAYVKRLAITGTWALMVGSVVIYACMAYLVYVRGTELPVSFALTVTGLLAAISLSVWASRFTLVRKASRYVSARTLPIYLVHPVLLSLLGGFAVLLGGGRSPIPHNLPVVNILAVPILTVLLTIGSILLFDLVMRTQAKWIFKPPFLGAEAPGVRRGDGKLSN